MFAGNILSFIIILLIALTLCAIVITIEQLYWYYKNKPKDISLKEKTSKKHVKSYVKQKIKEEEKQYKILKFLHLQRLIVCCSAILSFSIFRWIISIFVWITISITGFFATKRYLKINSKEIKEQKLVIAFLKICFFSFSFFLLQVGFSVLPFIKCHLNPNRSIIFYIYTGLTLFSFSIIIFAIYYFVNSYIAAPVTGWNCGKVVIYIDCIIFWLICIFFQVLWAVVYFNNLVSFG